MEHIAVPFGFSPKRATLALLRSFSNHHSSTSTQLVFPVTRQARLPALVAPRMCFAQNLRVPMKPRLLLVDDDEEIRTQMKWALTNDHDMFLAEDRIGALSLFRE